MPYFPDKNLLFIHIPKNAGMYVEKLLGIPQSIVSYETPTTGGFINYLRELRGKIKRKDELIEQLERKYLYGYYGGGYAYQHATLSEIVQMRLLDPVALEECRIIAVHRHPVSRAVSIYKYWGFYRETDFEGFCKKYLAKPWLCQLTHSQNAHLRTQSSYIDGAGKLSGNVRLLSFENLDADVARLSEDHGLSLTITKAVNKTSSKINVDVTSNAIDIIRSVYAEDFDRFGYETT